MSGILKDLSRAKLKRRRQKAGVDPNEDAEPDKGRSRRRTYDAPAPTTDRKAVKSRRELFPEPVRGLPIPTTGGYDGWFLPETYPDPVLRDLVNAKLLAMYQAAAEGNIPYKELKRRHGTMNTGASLEERIAIDTIAEALGLTTSQLLRRALFSYLHLTIPPRRAFEATIQFLRTSPQQKRPESAIERQRRLLRERRRKREK